MDESVQVLVEQMTFGLIAFGVDISLFFAWVYIEYRKHPAAERRILRKLSLIHILRTSKTVRAPGLARTGQWECEAFMRYIKTCLLYTSRCV